MKDEFNDEDEFNEDVRKTEDKIDWLKIELKRNAIVQIKSVK